VRRGQTDLSCELCILAPNNFAAVKKYWSGSTVQLSLPLASARYQKQNFGNALLAIMTGSVTRTCFQGCVKSACISCLSCCSMPVLQSSNGMSTVWGSVCFHADPELWVQVPHLAATHACAGVLVATWGRSTPAQSAVTALEAVAHRLRRL